MSTVKKCPSIPYSLWAKSQGNLRYGVIGQGGTSTRRQAHHGLLVITGAHLVCTQEVSVQFRGGPPTLDKNVKKKSKQLGMAVSTAAFKLRKLLIFSLLQKLGEDNCYRCGEKLDLKTLTIDHKRDWLDSENPVDFYFDVNNCAFSHHSCNARYARQPNRYKTEKERIAARKRSKRNYMRRQRISNPNRWRVTMASKV